MKITRALWRTGVTVLATTALVTQSLVPAASAAIEDVTEGYVDWGIKTSWRNYVGESATTLTDGVTQNADGTYRWPVTAGHFDADSDIMELSLAGTIHFQKHCLADRCVLDSTYSNLSLVVTEDEAFIEGDYSGVLREEIGSGVQTFTDQRIADLTRTAFSQSHEGDWYYYNAVPAVAGPGNYLYDAGTELDPVNIALNLAEAEESTSETPVADDAAPEDPATDEPATSGGIAGLITRLVDRLINAIIDLFKNDDAAAEETSAEPSEGSSEAESTGVESSEESAAEETSAEPSEGSSEAEPTAVDSSEEPAVEPTSEVSEPESSEPEYCETASSEPASSEVETAAEESSSANENPAVESTEETTGESAAETTGESAVESTEDVAVETSEDSSKAEPTSAEATQETTAVAEATSDAETTAASTEETTAASTVGTGAGASEAGSAGA
ncbi:MAG: HtaA domain-containing protein, partial [Corynebacterium sp.]|nr:HtaA domain-containing protein [Corynebacterium sp.]